MLIKQEKFNISKKRPKNRSFFYWKGVNMNVDKKYFYNPYRQIEKNNDLLYDKLTREEKNREYIEKLKEKLMPRKYC